MPDMFKPDYAYIPGINARHPEDLFDTICASAVSGASAAELANCDAFSHGLFYLENEYYWEAHEVLESVWLALPEPSEERIFVQGLIQFANASLKRRMSRPKAVQRLCRMARELINACNGDTVMRVDRQGVLARIDQLERGNNLSI